MLNSEDEMSRYGDETSRSKNEMSRYSCVKGDAILKDASFPFLFLAFLFLLLQSFHLKGGPSV